MGRSVKAAAGKPLARLGIISDIQFADIPDGKSFHGVPRYYRNAMVALQRAVDVWKQQDLTAAVHFGDIIDGFNDKATSADALSSILAVFDQLGVPHYHMLGNHCLYNLPRPELNRRLGIPSPLPSASDLERMAAAPGPGPQPTLTPTDAPGTSTSGGGGASNGGTSPGSRARGMGGSSTPASAAPQPDPGASYYSFSPHPAWRFVVADGYDISVLGWPPGHPLHERAVQTLREKNPNQNKNMPEGLVGPARRFVQFGGGASEAQLYWVRRQIEEAADAGQRVVVACHLPFMPGTCPWACLLYNYEEMLQVLRETRPGTVVATIAGHTHQNGYVMDEWGIHHCVLPAVLETPPGRDAYGRLDVYEDRLELVGVDTMMGLTMLLVAGQKGARQEAVASVGA